MKSSIIKKAKIFFIVALVVLVAGLTMFGVFEFNQAIDYKNGYEMQVSVDQKTESTVKVIKDATDKYLADKGIKAVDYATQTLDGGMTVIYKFSYDVTNDVKDLKATVQKALDADGKVAGVTADVVVSQVSGKDNASIGWIMLALGLAIVGMFVYALIMEKLAGAVATIFVSVLSAILYLALMGLTRIPAAPFVGVGGFIAVVISSIIAVATVNRYKNECKKAEKKTKAEIVDKVANNAKNIYILFGVAVLLVAVAICAIMPYLMFVGAQIVVAGICGISSAVFGTPFMWALVKRNIK
ncbi:MAG: hypothetical protein IJB32_06000 [Clostridia bacterium]|nr:hypothetical protein [Clostridia bacterium]